MNVDPLLISLRVLAVWNVNMEEICFRRASFSKVLLSRLNTQMATMRIWFL